MGARLSHDEGYSWLVASAPSAGAFFERLAAYENTPPLFYAMLAPLPLDSEVSLRLPSLVAGTLWIPVVYAIVRALGGGRRAALLGALAVAVLPYAVSFSVYSRGFMVAGLAELVALLAALRLRAGAPRTGRWAVVFVLACTAALYAQYASLAFVVVLVGGMIALERHRWRTWLALGAAPLALFAPWLGQLRRSLDQLGETKLEAVANPPSLGGARDAVVALAFGENGTASSGLLRTAQALIVVAVLAWAVTRLRRPAAIVAGLLVAIPVLHAVVAAVGTDVFRQRYLTILIPIGAIVVALALGRRALPVATIALLVLGGAVLVRRTGREYEPDYRAAIVEARAAGATTILTNSAVVAFYGRDGRVVLDRPLGLPAPGPRTCPGCVVIDDTNLGG